MNICETEGAHKMNIRRGCRFVPFWAAWCGNRLTLHYLRGIVISFR